MSDIIQLLPDSIANQIAAGEVIQRPASVVKELMENAIDAGSTEIELIIRDSGKTLIQVVDNGSGMSATDARLSFERHATSKIRQAADLFAIKTKGFRGEALASIAAIAQVEMITRLESEDLGTRLVLEGSEVKKQEFCQALRGTKISVKNLFFNVPARRKFLKTDSVELKHLTDEFLRIACAHESIKFTLYHNDREMYHLPAGNRIQRISGIWGKTFSAKLVPVSEQTDVVIITGYIGKPEAAKRSRNHQFLFVNNRFIKSSYLNHAVRMAYDNTIPADEQPVFFLFLDIPPDRIDINIHPTKQEIKFEEERLIYNYLRVSIKQALGKYSLIPTLDFEREDSFEQLLGQASETEFSPGPQWLGSHEKNREKQDWQQLFEGLNQDDPNSRDDAGSAAPMLFPSDASREPDEQTDGSPFAESGALPYQIHQSYILCPIKSGFILIDQQNAHERILYEKYFRLLEDQSTPSQQELFPQSFSLSPEKSDILLGLLPELDRLGFRIEEFGRHGFIVRGIPSGISREAEMEVLIGEMIEHYSENTGFRLGIKENLARSFAVSSSVKRNRSLRTEEMQTLVDELFACENPYTSPSGNKCFINFDLAVIRRNFSH